MGLNDKLMHQRLFAEKAGDDLGGAMRAHLRKRGADVEAANALIEYLLEIGERDIVNALESDSSYDEDGAIDRMIRGLDDPDAVDLWESFLEATAQEREAWQNEMDESSKSFRLSKRAKKPKTSGAATARDRSEARLTEALSRVQQCADAANAFWIEGNQAEALAALEDLLAESKATRQAITSHAENFPLEGEVMEGGEPVAESEMVGEDAEAVAMAAGEKSLKRKARADTIEINYLADGSEYTIRATVIVNSDGGPGEGYDITIEDIQVMPVGGDEYLPIEEYLAVDWDMKQVEDELQAAWEEQS